MQVPTPGEGMGQHATKFEQGMCVMEIDPRATRRIRILVADDHPLMRDGISFVISTQSDMELAGSASDGSDAIEQYRRVRPDVLLLDYQMPRMNGVDTTIALRQEFPNARIVMLTTYRGDAQALRAIRAGALGYLLKSTLHTELVNAIRAVHDGRRYLTSEVAMDLAAHVSDEFLSDRELHVLKLVAAGTSNKRVAAELGISEDTVKTHMRKILGKLGANDRTHAVSLALQRGILSL